MDNPNFEVDDIAKIRVMKIECSRCREKPVTVPALIFHDEMTVDRDSNIKRDIIAIFCQGDKHCDGQAWAFPVEPDNSIIRKREAFPTLTNDN